LEGTFEELLDAAHRAAAHGADFGFPHENLEAKLKQWQKFIFEPSFQTTLTQKSPGKILLFFYIKCA
jgi:hypothetical protein